MLSIGDLARHTRVSVRMLRHYDALGLVVPERVDAGTGYRWYAVSQVGRVNSLLALRELGFTLEQCRAVLDEEISIEELRGLLLGRRASLERQVAAVDRRLRSIERGLTVTNGTLDLKALPALRLAQVSAAVNDTSEIGAVTEALFASLTSLFAAAGRSVSGRGVRTFYGRPDGSKIDVAVALLTEDGVPGVDVVDLPFEPRGASVVHRGPVEELGDAWQAMDVALQAHGLESYGVHRQIYLDGDAIELQAPVRPGGTGC